MCLDLRREVDNRNMQLFTHRSMLPVVRCHGCSDWAHLVEEEGSSCSAGEAGGDELRAVGQDGVTAGAGEKPRATDVVQEDAAHSAAVCAADHQNRQKYYQTLSHTH